MGSVAPNQALASEVVDRLVARGVRTFCLCPGGRNAPLVEVLTGLSASAADVLDFFEERSASFFAIGRARRDGRPVAVVTTSGTASAELLPAMVEAYYAGVPLVALTADRPRSYRGTGAPQTIEQASLFGAYARQQVDLDRAGTSWDLRLAGGPVHVNVSFDEPLLGGWQPAAETTPGAGPAVETAVDAHLPGSEAAPDAERTVRSTPGCSRAPATTGAALHGATRPLVLLGAMPRSDDRADALSFCRALGAPVLAEASSLLKPHLGDVLLAAGEAAAQRGFEQGVFDSVIRIGDIPSFRLWRDLESAWRVPVLSISRRPWRGLTHGTHVQIEEDARLSAHLPAVTAFPGTRREELLAFDREAVARTSQLLREFPASEPALVRALSGSIPDRSLVYLGNSQPIREWNQFAVIEDRGLVFGENRGANGIDGQVSTFFGWAADDRENWAIVGDLTALYDLPSPWALRHVAAPVRIVVINNGGGLIFRRLFANPRFQNRHAVTFEAFASLWGLDYCRSATVPSSSRAAVIELRPDPAQTDLFWTALRAGIPK